MEQEKFPDEVCRYCGKKARFREWYPSLEKWMYSCSSPFWLCSAINGIAERIRPRRLKWNQK